MLAWIGALAIGAALGLLGSGGSILTVPVLVYLVGQDEKLAIAGSLFVVGAVAAAGSMQFAVRRQVAWRTVLLFGLPGMAGTYLGAWLSGLVSGVFQLAAFAVVMMLAAALMFHEVPTAWGDDQAIDDQHARHPWWIGVDGTIVGVVTGFVGVGGGFLIVPALVLLGGLSMHLAVGTSLVIITLKSFTGFVKYLDVLATHEQSLDWTVLTIVAALGIVGSIFGRTVGARLSQELLKRLFAIFLVVIGLLILLQTVPELL